MPKALYREVLLLSVFIVITAIGSFYLQKIIWKKIPELKKNNIEKISSDLEKQFANRVVSLMKTDKAVITDPAVTAAVDSVVNRLHATVDSFPVDLEVLVVDNSQVNAVALPGGVIIAFSALVRTTESAEEFAAVLAHETAHVIHRDPVKRMIRQLGISTVLSVMTGNSPYLQNTVETLLDATYTREQEAAADSLAFVMLKKSSISPKHFALFMDRLNVDSKEHTVAKYFSTHPAMTERIQKANTEAVTDEFEEHPLQLDWPAVKKGLPSLFD